MIQVLKQLNFILNAKQKRGLFLLLIGAGLIACMEAVLIFMMGPFTSMITGANSENNGIFIQIVSRLFSVNSNQDILKIIAILFIFFYLIRGTGKLLYNYLQAKLLALYRTDISVKLFSFVMHKPYAYHLQHNTAETLRLVNSDVANVFAMVNCLMQTISCSLVGFGVLLVLVLLDWKLTVILTLICCAFVLMQRKYLKPFIHKMANINFQSSSEMTKWINQAIWGLKTVLVKREQEYYLTRYKEFAEEAAIASSNYVAVDGIPKILIDTFCMVMMFSAVLLQIVICEDFAANLPVFASFAMAALRLIPVIGQVTTTLNAAAYFRPSLNAVDEVLRTGELEQQIENQIEHAEIERNLGTKSMSLERELQVSHVSFRYGDAQTELFDDLNLVIPAKKTVALIGTTGSGKTTLADLILGLHNPTCGNILVDGQDIQQNPVGWAKLIGYIPQVIYLCDDTIRANIALGAEKDQVDDDLVWNCLERAQLKEFIQSLPNGLDTMTGENGARLSGGQRQRIGIARALYSKPQFLLMDEATSSLDVETEKAIVDSIDDLSGDLTILIIAHRLATIENCDIVYRIENGRAYQI